jgi:hypothetical protein
LLFAAEVNDPEEGKKGAWLYSCRANSNLFGEIFQRSGSWARSLVCRGKLFGKAKCFALDNRGGCWAKRRMSGNLTSPASKPALDVSTVAELRDLASSLDRLCGGKPQVNISNQVGIVLDEATRMRLIKQREELLAKSVAPAGYDPT